MPHQQSTDEGEQSERSGRAKNSAKLNGGLGVFIERRTASTRTHEAKPKVRALNSFA